MAKCSDSVFTFCHNWTGKLLKHVWCVIFPDCLVIFNCLVLLQNHGWCAAGQKCQHSHDVDLILEYERHGHLTKKQRRAKKKLKNVEMLMDTVLTVDDSKNTINGSCSSDVSLTSESAVAMTTDDDAQLTSVVREESAVDNNSHGHRAGFDAFMTGCVFAWSLVTYNQKSTVDRMERTPQACDVTNPEFINRVYLGGKDFPLQVTQSCFAKPSKRHLEKWQLINSATDSQ